MNYKYRIQIKKNFKFSNDGVYMWRGSMIEGSSSDSLNDPQPKKVKLHHETESIIDFEVPPKIDDYGDENDDSEDHDEDNDEDENDDDEEEEDAMEYNFDELNNEIASITGQLYNRDALNNIHYFGDGLDDLALITTFTLLESDWACRDFMRNINSKANSGGFLHIEIGEYNERYSNDGSRGNPDHQALLLQYVIRYFTDSSSDRNLQITGTEVVNMLPMSSFVTLAAGRALEPHKDPDNSLLFRRFQFTQAGAREQRAEYWYLDCSHESFHQKVGNPLSLEEAHNVSVLYEPDESTHTLGTEAQEMLITLNDQALSENPSIEPILDLIKNRGMVYYGSTSSLFCLFINIL